MSQGGEGRPPWEGKTGGVTEWGLLPNRVTLVHVKKIEYCPKAGRGELDQGPQVWVICTITWRQRRRE